MFALLEGVELFLRGFIVSKLLVIKTLLGQIEMYSIVRCSH